MCPASAGGQYCKHRLAILGGEPEGLVGGNEAQVQTVATWLSSSDVEVMEALITAEREFENAEQELIKA
jgi:hypothetical protein